jgi:hypothetical protein
LVTPRFEYAAYYLAFDRAEGAHHRKLPPGSSSRGDVLKIAGRTAQQQ